MLLFLGILVPRALAEAPVEPKTAPIAPVSIETMITQSAAQYGVDRRTVARIIQCESQGDPKAIGDNGTSFGLVQIHLSAHQDIKKEEAFDQAFSINYLSHQLALGHGSMWSCY